MTLRSFIVGSLLLIALVVAGAGAFWGYRTFAAKSALKAVIALTTNVTNQVSGELDRSVKTLAQQVSEKVSEGLRSGAITAEEVRRHLSLQEQIDKQLLELESHRASANRDLYEATLEYVTDGRHLLRRIHAHARSRAEVLVELGALDDLRRAAGTRAGNWISEMVATKKKVDKAAFDYRNAVTALDTSLGSMKTARVKLAVHVEPGLLVREELIDEFRKQLTDSMIKLANVIEGAGTLERRR